MHLFSVFSNVTNITMYMYIKIAPNFIRNFTDFFFLLLPAKFSILIRFFLRHLKEKKNNCILKSYKFL